MNILTKRSAAIALAIGGAALTAACGGHGPNSYLMPKDAVMAKLTDAEREFSLTGNDSRSIEAQRWEGDTLVVRFTQAGSRSVGCFAHVEAINDDWTRVNPDCGEGSNAKDTAEREIARMQVDEWVIAVLHDKPMDEAMIRKRTLAVAIDHVGEGMREEAEQRRQNRARDRAAAAAVASGTDWGSESPAGGDWGS